MISTREADNSADIDNEFKSYDKFKERMAEIQNILVARRAVAKIQYLERYLEEFRRRQIREINIEKTQDNLSQYNDSVEISEFEFRPLNEVTLVLLSAYLEAFIEELHGEAVHKLLHISPASSNVVEGLIERAHDQFDNPRPNKIIGLFDTCCIDKITSKLHPEIKRGKINDFVDIRNEIAHGEHRSVSNAEVKEWSDYVSRYAESLFRAVKNEVTAITQA